PRRTIRAFDRMVHIGHHAYVDMPIDDLLDALVARAKPLLPAAWRPKRPEMTYRRGLAADDKPIEPSDVATAINDLFDRHGAMPMTSDVAIGLSPPLKTRTTRSRPPPISAGM